MGKDVSIEPGLLSILGHHCTYDYDFNFNFITRSLKEIFKDCKS